MPFREHMRCAFIAAFWVGGGLLLYAMIGLPLAFATLHATQVVAMMIVSPALPAAWLMRLGLHPIASVALTFLAYWLAGFGVVEWRAHHNRGETAIAH
jgi:hypothetical protein